MKTANLSLKLFLTPSSHYTQSECYTPRSDRLYKTRLAACWRYQREAFTVPCTDGRFYMLSHSYVNNIYGVSIDASVHQTHSPVRFVWCSTGLANCGQLKRTETQQRVRLRAIEAPVLILIGIFARWVLLVPLQVHGGLSFDGHTRAHMQIHSDAFAT